MKSAKRTWSVLPALQMLTLRHRRISFGAGPDVLSDAPSPQGEAVKDWRFSGLKISVAAGMGLIMGCWLLCAQRSAAQQEPTPVAPAAQEEPTTKALSPEAEQALVEDTNKTAVLPNAGEEEDRNWRFEDNGRAWGTPMVVIGRDAELKAGDAVEALVVIGGNGKVHGRVRQAAVAIGGDLDIDGQIGDAAVAVLGNITAHKGARVRGDAVAVGGRVEVAEGAHVKPAVVQFPDIRWLRKWFIQCVLLMRPLSLKVTWVWLVAGVFLLFYILIAALFPRPVHACVNELTERPATTFCMGLLTILLLPLALAILGITGIGLLVVPFVLAALFFGALIGRVAILEWIGWRLAHQFGAQSFNNPVAGLLLGALLVAVVYLVPFLGLLTFAIIGLWSLGGAVTAAFGGLRREMPEKPKTPPPAEPVATLAVTVPAGASSPPDVSPAAEASSTTNPQVQSQAQAAQVPPLGNPPPVVPEILTYPKARFWERISAALLDIILVSVVCAVLHPIWPIIILAYFSGLWAWKATTVGGIIVGLKVVRVDGQPLNFAVTLVRSLAAAFSVMVLFLGYLWIAWDPEKQGWHDKIAGTVVLRLPKGTPLL